MTFLIFLLFIASGWFLISCKWEYDRQESLVKLESQLRSGDWEGANHATRRILAIIIYRDCKGIPCVSPSLRKQFPVGKFLYETINRRQQKLGIDMNLGSTEHFSTEEIEKFPMDKLQAIDNIWTKYSQGRFGFSVQASIYKQYEITSNRSIRNDEFTLNDGSKVKASQVKLWYDIQFLDYVEKYEKKLLLELNWMVRQNVPHYPSVRLCIESKDLNPDIVGMFPCSLSNNFFCSPISFFLWRKLLRGSVID
ncbi:GUN4 domain-containing protein [Roseofilum sp. BLCC_M91]|uniref:GUN4 domain-containing protein n=1 Tax=Roseofilum halophilum BLCC-M91 TaxID=3022259 RepID=A0ABT7BJ92_9CYAN|nr:GUN4 domain-containing protein [Roseofilum halophilum]MDJ1179229.1 GUN4 domain-containing protein [Roseofilum halophilum BLCC-M91]